MSARLFPILILALGVCPALRAFDFIDDLPAWPGGTVRLELQLGSSPTYSDGTTPNSTAIQALQAWNPSMDRVQLGYVNNSSAAKSRTNGKNNVFFSNKVYGTAFNDGVLAVTTYRNGASAPIEADIIVNNEYSWDSYRGYLQTKVDLRRVLIHEIGHVLGLDHPDEAGQWVDAIMNSYISDVDALRQDDMDGASVRYGRGPGNPATMPVVTEHPYSISTMEGYFVSMYGSASGSLPIAYQWLKDGVAIPGATENLLQFQTVRVSDAGKYQIRFTNDAGSVTSNEAILAVSAATPPVFQQHPPAAVSVEEGAGLYISAWATSNVSINYQWMRDDVDIPGATSGYLSLYNITSADAGTYRLVATNIAGSATSDGAVVTITPAKPPVITSQPSSGTTIIGQSHTFYSSVSSAQTVTYQWTHDGVDIPGATYYSLYLPAVTAADAGVYRLVATNIAGSVTSEPATLRIDPLPPPPAIVLQNTTVAHGSTISFYIYTPWPSLGITYQWYKDGVAIPNATSSQFYVSFATSADSGEYFVVTTNASGTTTSTTSIVNVAGSTSTPLGGWVQSIAHSGIVYFLFENPSRLERFDMATEAWMPPLPLTRAPTHMAIASSTTAVLAFGRTLATLDLGTGLETTLGTLEHTPVQIQAHRDRVFFLTYDPIYSSQRRFGSMSLGAPGAVSWLQNYSGIGASFAIDPTHAQVLFTKSWSAGVIARPINEDGSFGDPTETPYSSSSSQPNRTYLRPDDAVILSNDGLAYATTTLTSVGLIAPRIDAVAFADDLMLVLSASTVTCFDADLVELGILTLARIGQQIAVHGDQLFAFTQPASGAGATITWEKRPLADIAVSPPQPTASPSNLTYAADDVLLDRDGTVLIYSRVHGNVFRWSTTEQRYLASIPLHGRPNSLAYSPETHRLYTGYADGRIRVIDFDESLEERMFATSSRSSMGLGAAGEYLFVQNQSYSSGPLSVYDSSGQLTDSDNWGSFSRSSVWNASRRRLYHFQDGSSPNDLLYTEVAADGTIGAFKNSPYHGDVAIQGPIRISPSGEVLLLGSGNFFNVDTLAQNNTLPHTIQDAAWVGQKLFTMRTTLNGVEVQRWGGSNYGLDATLALRGTFVRLLAYGDSRLVAITRKDGRLIFTLLDASLKVKTHFATTPDQTHARLANLSTRARVGTGDNIMIAGFVVNGTQPKRILVRAAGPTLKPMGVPGELLDPVLRVVTPDGAPIVDNDNWYSSGGDALRQIFADVGAFPMADDSRDAALVVELPPGRYTAQVSGKDGTSGVALVETYDVDEGQGDQRLINISTRAVVGIGDQVMIPGLVIDGTEPKRVLIRAVGPGLSIFGLGGLLADPQFRVVNRASEIVVANDNWGSDNVDVTVASSRAAGAFDLAEGSQDAALVTTLAPGSYTVIVSGVNDTTGLALVEIYEVP